MNHYTIPTSYNRSFQNAVRIPSNSSNNRTRIRFNQKNVKVVGLISFMILFLLVFASYINNAKANNLSSQHNKSYVTVHTGQTLWSIAKQATLPGEDVRDTVYQICELNHLSSNVILPGMKLILPR